MKILIVRNDKLGDFILSYPVYSLIKSAIPGCKLHVLVPSYTLPLARENQWVDHVIEDPGSSATWSEQYHLFQSIRQQRYDVIITLFSTTRIGFITWLAGIKYRLAPATKIAQFFYNHSLIQRRSCSLKPEFEYNLDLAKQFLSDHDFNTDFQRQFPEIHFSADEIDPVRQEFFSGYNLPRQSRLIFIHPGTGGSATNLSLEQYADLVSNLNLQEHDIIVITAGPAEMETASTLSRLLGSTPHIVYPSTKGLVYFTKFIQLCDLFISASTGPLHIAGALDRPTAAFYQRRRSATALRWQTLNSEGRRLAFMPPEEAGESDMQKIDVIEAAKKINETFLDSN